MSTSNGEGSAGQHPGVEAVLSAWQQDSLVWAVGYKDGWLLPRRWATEAEAAAFLESRLWSAAWSVVRIGGAA